MAILDIILLICFIPAIVSGITRGFVKQLVNLASIIIGAWAAFRFSASARNSLSVWFQTADPKILYVLSFAVIVVAVILILNLIGELLCKVISIASLNALNRLAGVVLGVLKTALLLGLIILVFEGLNSKWELLEPSKLENAAVYQWIRGFARTIFPYLKDLVTGGTAINV